MIRDIILRISLIYSRYPNMYIISFMSPVFYSAWRLASGAEVSVSTSRMILEGRTDIDAHMLNYLAKVFKKGQVHQSITPVPAHVLGDVLRSRGYLRVAPVRCVRSVVGLSLWHKQSHNMKAKTMWITINHVSVTPMSSICLGGCPLIAWVLTRGRC